MLVSEQMKNRATAIVAAMSDAEDVAKIDNTGFYVVAATVIDDGRFTPWYFFTVGTREFTIAWDKPTACRSC